MFAYVLCVYVLNSRKSFECVSHRHLNARFICGEIEEKTLFDIICNRYRFSDIVEKFFSTVSQILCLISFSYLFKMSKKTIKYCDVCQCEKTCKIFSIESRNSKAFHKIKQILGLDQKKRLYICEEHYPRDAVKEGKNGKILDKDARDQVPTINIPRNDRPDQISMNESVPANEVFVAELPTKQLEQNQTDKLIVSKCDTSQRVEPHFFHVIIIVSNRIGE